eukprot:CAMPEP_0172783354 /NCGR_PEP_ID=MMETSP1074-20121228/204394_1 /TAXON_ID=2916 /ORGANISM="Ceratium fusus, Strain PA161109" /LENGTH=329 /DNA_ID=CAMNT_0013620343 /DNA_START=3 /DNA_END=992 /DNA_ORIENTATION=+
MVYGAPAHGMAVPLQQQAQCLFRLPPATPAAQPNPVMAFNTICDGSELSSPVALPHQDPQAAPLRSPSVAAFEPAYAQPAWGTSTQPAVPHSWGSIASSSPVGVDADYPADTGGGPWMEVPSFALHDLLPPVDFVFHKDPKIVAPIMEEAPVAPPLPVSDWKRTREIPVTDHGCHAQSLEQLASQIQDLVGSQEKLNMELRELKQQVYSNCQDLEGIRQEEQSRFAARSHRYSNARLSPPPAVSTQQQPMDPEDDLIDFPASPPTSNSVTTKNLGYDNTQDMLSNVQDHAARGLDTLHRHSARALQKVSDGSWLASVGRISTRMNVTNA